MEENEGKSAGQSGINPLFELEKFKCYVVVKEVGLTFLLWWHALRRVCKAACRQQIFFYGYSLLVV